MLEVTVIAALGTYVLMLAAFYLHRLRAFHGPVMLSVILFDIGMPIYLVMNRDWNKRLIEQGDIMSFGIWMHFGLIIALYVLYAVQIQTALVLRRSPGEDTAKARKDHRAQGKGILLARGLVILTGAILVESPELE